MIDNPVQLTRRAEPSAIAHLPDLESLLGVRDKAAEDANRMLGMARALRNLDRIQLLEKKEDADAIPGISPESDGRVDVNGQRYRTFAQQRELIRDAYARLWQQIEEEGYRAAVEEQLRVTRNM